MAMFGGPDSSDANEKVVQLAMLRFGVHNLDVSVQFGSAGPDAILVDHDGRQYPMRNLIAHVATLPPNSDQFYQAIMRHVDAVVAGEPSPTPVFGMQSGFPSAPVVFTDDRFALPPGPSAAGQSAPATAPVSFPGLPTPFPGLPNVAPPSPFPTNPGAAPQAPQIAPWDAPLAPQQNAQWEAPPAFATPSPQVAPPQSSPWDAPPAFNAPPQQDAQWAAPPAQAPPAMAPPAMPPPAMAPPAMAPPSMPPPAPPAQYPPPAVPMEQDPLIGLVRMRLVAESTREFVNLHYARPIAQGIIAVLSTANAPDVFLTDESLEGRNITALFDAAFSNTMAEPFDANYEVAPGVRALAGDSLFTASKSVGMGVLISGQLPHAPLGVVFGVPNQHIIYVHIVTGPDLIHAVNALATLVVENATADAPGGVLSDLTYYWNNGVVEAIGFPNAEGKVQIEATGAFGRMLNEVMR